MTKSTVFRKSWYEGATFTAPAPTCPLQDNTLADVCIIGAGFTGLSAALELARRNYRVVVLDAAHGVAASASGRNGGHIQRGLARPPAFLAKQFGTDTARALCTMSFEGIDLIRARIAEHAIDCDFHPGQLTAALTPRHMRELEDEQRDWRDIVGQDGMTLLDHAGCQSYVCGKGYIGGLYDPLSAHFNPYAYSQGLAKAAQSYGTEIYDQTRVISLSTLSGKHLIQTESGASVTASYVLVAGAIDLPQMRAHLRRSISATAHMIATAPLAPETAKRLMPGNVAVADANFVMNYYRLSQDLRLLFGGNCNYSGRETGYEHMALRHRLLTVFPELETLEIDHCWSGPLDLTANRLPDIGRLAPTVFYAHGFGGHGVAATNLIGALIAEAIAGTAERFDVFERIDHIPFAGGALTKRPLFMLGMLWYRLRDLLHT